MTQTPPIPRGVWVLGFVSLLMDVSSEMIHSLLPVFMVSVLGASVLMVGIVEGIAEATALIVKVFSGALSDRLGKRKGLAVLGYGLGALSKPLFALATTLPWVLSARFIDRIGKGIRGAPRDALIADITPPAIRGAAYGLRQSLDTVGGFAGPLLAIALMIVFAGDFRTVFWFALIPAVLCVALLIAGVREPDAPAGERKARVAIHWRTLGQLSRDYWWVVAIGGVFTLARFSEAFLILRARDFGLPDTYAPAVLIAMNVVYALTAYPAGRLADRMDHRTLLLAGLALLVVADLVLAYASGLAFVAAGVVLWGLHMGLTQGLLATMVADTAPAALRGTAFGFFNFVSGIAMLIASVLAGGAVGRLRRRGDVHRRRGPLRGGGGAAGRAQAPGEKNLGFAAARAEEEPEDQTQHRQQEHDEDPEELLLVGSAALEDVDHGPDVAREYQQAPEAAVTVQHVRFPLMD